jgi:transposase
MVREFDKRYTLIAACNWNGFVHEACHIVEREYNKDDENPDRGTVDTARFEQYVQDYLIPVLENSANSEPNSIVVMDNASIHNSEKVRELIEDAGALLVYTAPYSPEYNPIEYMFGEYKKALKGHSHQSGYDWIAVHQEGLASVNPMKARAFFRHCKVRTGVLRGSDGTRAGRHGTRLMSAYKRVRLK